jgi:hypothetical protein
LKNFFTLLLIFTLTFTTVGRPYKLYAQETSTASSPEEGAVYTEELVQKSDSELGGEIAMTTIMMFATVLMAPFFAISCPTKPSALIFVAGALFFIGQEIYNWVTYKSASDKLMKIYDNVAEADKQVESLRAAGEQTLQAANKASLKGNFAMAIAIMWGVASAVAFIEGAIGAIMAALGKVDEIGPCKGVPPIGMGQINEEFLDPNLFQKSASLREIAQVLSSGRNDLESFVLLKEKNSFYKGNIQSIGIDEYENIKETDILAQHKNAWAKNLSKLLTHAMNLVIPKAHAEDTTDDSNKDAKDPDNVKSMASAASFGITGAVLAAIFASVPSIKSSLMGAYSNPFIRGAVFAVFAGFAGGATALIKEGASKLENQGNQYLNLMQQLLQANSQLALKTGISQSARTPIIKPMSAAVAAQSINGQCFTGGRGKLRTDPGCNCKNSKSCKSSGMPTIKFEGFKTPNTMKNLVNSNGQIIDKYYQGDLSGANLSAEGNNNRNAARLKKLNKSVRGSVNKLLKQAGKEPYDFDKEISSQSSALASTFRNGYNNLSGDLKSKLFNFDKDKKIMDRKETNSRGSGGTGKVRSPSSKAAPAKAKPTAGNIKFDFSLDDEEEEKKAAGMGYEDEAKNGDADLDQYETEENDVSQKSETSIFKIIETRYLKTAYPIFFEEEK